MVEFKWFWLAGPEGDDAADRIVRRNSHGHAIPRDHLDAKPPHSAAELGQHFMASVALHAIEPAAVHRDYGTLHVDQIVLAQLLAYPFGQLLCHSPAYLQYR